MTNPGIAEERLLFGAAEYDGRTAAPGLAARRCRRSSPPRWGRGSVVTLTPKYVASHTAAAVSLPPLLSITWVTAWVGTLPPAVVAKPSMCISDAQRVVASFLRPLALTNVTCAPSASAADVGKMSWTKCEIELKL